MKISIVHPQMAMYGGAERVIVKLTQYLQSKGHQVRILTLSTKSIDDYIGLDIITPAPKDRVEYRLRSSIASLSDIGKMYVQLRKLCNEYAVDTDVFNAHNFPAIWAVPSKYPNVWLCNEVPDLWHQHHISMLVNPLLNSGRWIDRTIARSKHPDVIVADFNMAKIFEHRYLIHPNIIPYGIDGEFFAQCKHKESAKDFHVLQAAMISPSKNQFGVLKAVNALRIQIPGIHVTFAGYMEPNNEYVKTLQDYVRDNSMQKIVNFTGLVTREYLRDLYSTTNVAVFSGKGQGSWLGPFEAIAAQVPVIVSPYLTCSSLLDEYNLGDVSNELVWYLKGVYNSYELLHSILASRQQFVLKELTWEKYCKAFETILLGPASV